MSKPRSRAKAPAVAEPTGHAEFARLFFARDYVGALKIAERMTRIGPRHPRGWMNAGLAAIYLRQFQQAYDSLSKAKALGGRGLEIPDGLAHAAFQLGRLDEMCRHGTQALRERDAQVPRLAQALPPRPAFDPTRPSRNVVAFSLYGADPRYCETALLNARAMPSVYPEWRCRVYVDASVPADVQARLRDAGADVSVVDGEAAALPGTMWRFLAADDPEVDFAVFRDADSLIGPRERRAVDEWLASDRWFHVMRDSGSHTELILAGMWGMRRGVLPALAPSMQDYVRSSPHPTHVDQMFLRERVWPYARESVLIHDSFFDFMQSRAFPDGPPASEVDAVGNDIARGFFTGNVDLPDGSVAQWTLHDAQADAHAPPVCGYRSVVRGGQINVHLPRPLLLDVGAGRLVFRVQRPNPASPAAG